MFLLNLGLMKIRLVSASDLFFLPLTDTPFISVHMAVFPDVIAEGRGCVVLSPFLPTDFLFP